MPAEKFYKKRSYVYYCFMCILLEETRWRIKRDIVKAYRENPDISKEELSSFVTTCAKNGVILKEGNKVVIQFFSDDMEELVIFDKSFISNPTSRSDVFPDEYSTIQFNPGD